MRTSRSLFESRHSCYHCQRIIIDPSVVRIHKPPQVYATMINSFEFSAAEVTRAIQDKCLLFQGLTSTKDRSEIVTKMLNEVQLGYE
jgi:hypothetical protein